MNPLHDTPESFCPACGYRLNSATVVAWRDVEPQPGDMSLCGRCGKLMVFGNDLTLRRPTDLERKIFLMHPMHDVAREIGVHLGHRKRENN